MEWILDRTDGQPLTALPCDLDPDWIIAYLRDLRTRTDAFEFTHRTDDYTDYNLRLFERAANRPAYAVATACGLGRCTPAEAEKAAAATAATATFSDHWLRPHTEDL
ncbi:hypothetical protein V7968_32430 [Nocardia vulneris]